MAESEKETVEDKGENVAKPQEAEGTLHMHRDTVASEASSKDDKDDDGDHNEDSSNEEDEVAIECGAGARDSAHVQDEADQKSSDSELGSDEEASSKNQQDNGSDSDQDSHSHSNATSNGDDDEEEDDEQEEEGGDSSTLVQQAKTEDGHTLSEYEMLRLERIKRNREYLASLGLEKAKPQRQQLHSRSRKRKKEETIRQRSSLSRRTKKDVSYAEKPSRHPNEKLPVERKKAPKPPEGDKRIQQRLERFIYVEFRRIEAERKRLLRTAQKYVRAASVELRHAEKQAQRFLQKEKRRFQVEELLKRDDEERRLLGQPKRLLLMEIVQRTPEIVSAMRTLDSSMLARCQHAVLAMQQEEHRRKMEMIDAIDRFPGALKTGKDMLDRLLLERAPKDPPPPRRGTRKRSAAVADVSHDDDGQEGAKKPKASEEWGGLAAAIAAETLSSSQRNGHYNEESILSPMEAASQNTQAEEKPTEKEATRKKRQAPPRNVGGWISPDFSKQIDRSWLERDAPEKEWKPSTYVPQIGDTVLYFPAGHRSFLKVHPDIIGKKTRNLLRLPLWDRAKREQNRRSKAASEAGEDSDRKESSEAQNQQRWWTDEWLSGMDGPLGTYPLLCRVERTHAEFPPDPNAEHRIVKKDEKGGGVQILWTVPKGGPVGHKAKMPLCIAVTLHPLTPLLPPRAVGQNETENELALPPNFTIVSFPSRKASPFVLPFVWAYARSHSLSVGSEVTLQLREEFPGYVKAFKALGSGFAPSQLDDKMDIINRFLIKLRIRPKSVVETVENELSKNKSDRASHHSSIPLSDLFGVVNVLASKGCPERELNPLDLEAQTGLLQLIRSTLPLWKGVTVIGPARKTRSASAWEVIHEGPNTEQAGRPLAPTIQGTHLYSRLIYSIDDPLRAKLECTLEDFIRVTPDASLFCPLLSDEDAPSYSSAVPLGMSFDRILSRLKNTMHISEDTADRVCYYRTVDSLLNDISMVLDNCILYNSPDSFVVEKALEIVPALKKQISQEAARHYKEKECVEKQEEQRRNAIMLQCHSPVIVKDEAEILDSKPARRRGLSKASYLHKPFTEKLQRSWLQSIRPDGTMNGFTSSISQIQGKESATEVISAASPMLSFGSWVPQTGDFILYSWALHSKFVKGHHPSLTTDQCKLPQFAAVMDKEPESNTKRQPLLGSEELSEHLNSRWLVGNVVWVRAEFPRPSPQAEEPISDTFESASPVLAMGIYFCYSWAGPRNVYKICWRPCDISDDSKISGKMPTCQQTCRGCGLAPNASFLRPAWIPLDDLQESQIYPHDVLVSDTLGDIVLRPPCLSDDWARSVDRCLNELKRRCLSDVPPDLVDPRLTVENAKKGYRPPNKAGRSLPTFERLLEKGNTMGSETTGLDNENVRTRGVEHVDEEAIALLEAVHYLPPWTSDLSSTKGKDQKTNRTGIEKSLSSHETKSPCPNLCLELIQLRLRQGYYRTHQAVVHDIQEAYVSSVLLTLFEPASRRKGKPLSIKKVSKSLASGEFLRNRTGKARATVQTDEEESRSKTKSFSDEEISCLERIARVRRLYATAWVCATYPAAVERIFGTEPKRRAKPVATVEGSPEVERKEKAQLDARRKLEYLLAVLSRDPANNRPQGSALYPAVKVKISGSFVPAPSDSNQPTCMEERNKMVPVSTQLATSEGEAGHQDDEVSVEASIDLSRPIIIDPETLMTNDRLSSLIYGKDGRRSTCARCDTERRPIFFCRVVSRHSNIDFDWMKFFKENGSLDSLLHMIRTGERLPNLPVPFSSTPAIASSSASDTAADAGNPAAGTSGMAGAVEASLESTTEEQQNLKDNPLEILDDARRAREIAEGLATRANELSSRPLRLSDDFIKATFPIDDSDGHYNYCIICGLSGDVICCEGCPNVVHAKCAGLDEIPDEDWYCSKCGKAKSCASSSDACDSAVRSAEAFGAVKERGVAMVETSRVTSAAIDDDDLMEDEKTVSELLTKLRNARRKPGKNTDAPPDREDKGQERDTQTTFSQKATEAPREEATESTDGPEQERGKLSSTTQHKSVAESTQKIEIGTKIVKTFDGMGDFVGVVKELASKENPFYRVRYEDGDEEDLSENEAIALMCKDTEAGGKAAKDGSPPRRARSDTETREDDQSTNEAPKRRGRPRKSERPSDKPRSESLHRKRGRPRKNLEPSVDENSSEDSSQDSRRKLKRDSQSNRIPESDVLPSDLGRRTSRRKRKGLRRFSPDRDEDLARDSRTSSRRGRNEDEISESDGSRHAPLRKRGRSRRFRPDEQDSSDDM